MMLLLLQRQLAEGDLDFHGSNGHDGHLLVEQDAEDLALAVEPFDVNLVAGP